MSALQYDPDTAWGDVPVDSTGITLAGDVDMDWAHLFAAIAAGEALA
jgi:hypothetical protein